MKRVYRLAAVLMSVILSLGILASCGGSESNDETELKSIGISAMPNKTEYRIGEPLDLGGGILKLNHADGTTKFLSMINENVTATGFDSSAAAQVTVTLHYKTKTAAFEISVKGDSVTPDPDPDPEPKVKLRCITVSKLPKTEYIVGQTLDLGGGELELEFDDGSKKTIPMTDKDVTVSGFDASTTGSQTVTLRYGEKSAEFRITVGEPILDRIEFENMPATVILEGGDLSLEYGTIKEIYTGGAEISVPLSRMRKTAQYIEVSGFNKGTLGKQSISLKYKNKELHYDINVVSPAEFYGHYVTKIPELNWTNETEFPVLKGEASIAATSLKRYLSTLSDGGKDAFDKAELNRIYNIALLCELTEFFEINSEARKYMSGGHYVFTKVNEETAREVLDLLSLLYGSVSYEYEFIQDELGFAEMLSSFKSEHKEAAAFSAAVPYFDKLKEYVGTNILPAAPDDINEQNAQGLDYFADIVLLLNLLGGENATGKIGIKNAFDALISAYFAIDPTSIDAMAQRAETYVPFVAAQKYLLAAAASAASIGSQSAPSDFAEFIGEYRLFLDNKNKLTETEAEKFGKRVSGESSYTELIGLCDATFSRYGDALYSEVTTNMLGNVWSSGEFDLKFTNEDSFKCFINQREYLVEVESRTELTFSLTAAEPLSDDDILFLKAKPDSSLLTVSKKSGDVVCMASPATVRTASSLEDFAGKYGIGAIIVEIGVNGEEITINGKATYFVECVENCLFVDNLDFESGYAVYLGYTDGYILFGTVDYITGETNYNMLKKIQ